jgi:hypothetical protein
MAIQLLSDNILIRDGAIATNSDCCCTPPCLPCTDRCRTAYNDSCNECVQINGYTFTISDFEAYDPYFPCNCDEINATYVVSNPAMGVCSQTTTCVLSDAFNACAKVCSETDTKARYKSIAVQSRFFFMENDVTIEAGNDVATLLPSMGFSTEKACNDFTVNQGHLFFVRISETSYNIKVILSDPTFCYFAERITTYVYSFDNRVDVAGCPADQFRGNYGSLILDFGAGTMTPFAVRGYYTVNPPSSNLYGPCTYNYFYDCNDYPQLCNLGTVKLDTVSLPPLNPSPC